MSKYTSQLASISQRVICWGLAAILLLMPFHAFFSIYFGSLGFNQSLVQSWKEVLVVLLTIVWLIFVLLKNKLPFRLDPTNVLFIAIVGLSLIVTIVIRPNPEAVLFGIKTNLVAIVVFFIAQIPLPSKVWINKNLLWLVLVPGFLVAILAILQATVVPESLMASLGYNSSTINPKQIVDGSIPFHRAFATLGGPNQLGTYLILPMVFSLVYGLKQKKFWLLIISFATAVGIGLSFSRSAWIAAAFALIVSIAFIVNRKGKIILAGSIVVIMALTVLLLPSAIQNNPRLENVLLHGRVFEDRLEGSDQLRLDAIEITTKEVLNRPFGHGLGSAGPASFQTSSPVIPENWYLQIAYEIGIVGAVLYILAFAALLGDFIRNRKQLLAVSLFAVTSGVLVANLFLHSWADSTLVLIMFVLYGLYKGHRK